jgi:hypothetical protein
MAQVIAARQSVTDGNGVDDHETPFGAAAAAFATINSGGQNGIICAGGRVHATAWIWVASAPAAVRSARLSDCCKRRGPLPKVHQYGKLQ